MKIGIITDSHDHHVNVLKAIKVFNEQKVEYVFHAGDIVSPFTAKAFEELKGSKFIAVYGNNDGEKLYLKTTIEGFGGEIHDDAYKGEIDGKKIFMTHRPTVIEEVALSGKFDLIIHGHTHRIITKTVGKTLVINSGESTDWLTGKSEVIVVDLADMSYERISL
jgi:putative phosphoesterase